VNQSRTRYFLLICGTIALGLLSRRIPGVPLFIGDILWAMMIFFIARFLVPKAEPGSVAIYSLLFCYLIEISQLWQAPWLVELRRTLPGRLILGQGFLWSDIVCYSLGILIIWSANRRIGQ